MNVPTFGCMYVYLQSTHTYKITVTYFKKNCQSIKLCLIFLLTYLVMQLNNAVI